MCFREKEGTFSMKLYKRENGYYYLDYTLNGKRKRISLKTNLKEVAEAKSAEIRLQIDRQRLELDPEAISTAKFFEDYKRSARQRLSPNSFKRYRPFTIASSNTRRKSASESYLI